MPSEVRLRTLNNGEMHREVTERIRCARSWCNRHWSLLRDPTWRHRAKFQLYKTFVRPILTYGCETWNLDNRTKKRLHNFESSILFEIYKSKYPLKDPKRLRPNPFAVFAKFKDKGIVEHVTNDHASWDALLYIEEAALERTNMKQKRVSWKKPPGGCSKCVKDNSN